MSLKQCMSLGAAAIVSCSLLVAPAMPVRAQNAPAQAAPVRALSEARPPNLVIILADDLGYADVGFNGRKLYHTPNLDKLAREGTIFRRFYSGGVICGPSRASLLTGKYTIHTGVSGNGRDLPADETNLAEALKPLGYRSALIGKWDSGGLPVDRGFDEFIGYANDAEAWEHFPKYLWFGHEKRPVSGFSADLLAGYGADFVKRNKNNPFLLYLAFIEPHLKLEAPAADIARLHKTIPEYDPSRPYNATYAAMIERFDKAVGHFLDALKASGEADNTIVVLTSDHGATFESGNLGAAADLDSNRPFRGGKRSVFEGGARVPAVIRWPGHIPARRVSQDVLDQIDILPTFMAAAGGKPDPAWHVDGANELAAWEGKAKPAPRTLFWEYRNEGWYNMAAMSGDWKLVVENKSQFTMLRAIKPIPPDKITEYEAALGDVLAEGKSFDTLSPEVKRNLAAATGTLDGPKLFNVATDPGERRNYYFTRPEIAQKLRADLLAWLATETKGSKDAPRTDTPPPPGGPD